MVMLVPTEIGDGGPGEHRRRASRAPLNGRTGGNQFNYCLGHPISFLGAPGRVLTGDSGIRSLLLGHFPNGAVAGSSAGTDGNQRHHPYHGVAADGPGDRVYRNRY